jgi:hypothetical protein
MSGKRREKKIQIKHLLTIPQNRSSNSDKKTTKTKQKKEDTGRKTENKLTTKLPRRINNRRRKSKTYTNKCECYWYYDGMIYCVSCEYKMVDDK